jgi:hypothetical protein
MFVSAADSEWKTYGRWSCEFGIGSDVVESGLSVKTKPWKMVSITDTQKARNGTNHSHMEFRRIFHNCQPVSTGKFFGQDAHPRYESMSTLHRSRISLLEA